VEPTALAWVAEVCGATRARRQERVQGLWSGYGEIVRVALDEATVDSVIVKWVRPPAAGRGTRDVGDERKRRSYAVEAAWYRGLASRCDESCRIPRPIAIRQTRGGGAEEWLFVLEDLDAAGFAGRAHRLEKVRVRGCLSWLASFHARFLGVAPEGLWKVGTYWHLATRREELLAIDDPRIREAAPLLDRQLSSAAFLTLVHGDAKPANFCFGRGGGVAAVDFQYVGGGCGMKDVAYLLDGEDAGSTRTLLDHYFGELAAQVRAVRPEIDAAAVEAAWRPLFAVASADYQRFLAGWGRGR